MIVKGKNLDKPINVLHRIMQLFVDSCGLAMLLLFFLFEPGTAAEMRILCNRYRLYALCFS